MQPTPYVIRAQMRDAEAVLQKLDNKLAAIIFDPAVPASVEAATRETKAVIDALLVDFAGNPVLGPLADQLKIQYLESVRHRVLTSQTLQSAATRTLSGIGMLARVWGNFRDIR